MKKLFLISQVLLFGIVSFAQIPKFSDSLVWKLRGDRIWFQKFRFSADSLPGTAIGQYGYDVNYNPIRMPLNTGGSISKNSRADSLSVGGVTVADKYSANNNPAENFNSIKWSNSKFYGALNNISNYNILLMGDSKTEYQWILEKNFKDIIGTKFIFSGPGYIGNNGINAYNMASTVSFAGTGWVKLDANTGGNAADIYSITSTTGAADWDFYPLATPASAPASAFSFDSITVFYLGKSGGGTFTVLSDGSTIGTINTSSGATGFRKVTFATGSDAPHTIKIHLSSQSTNGCELLGFNCFRSTKGIRVHKIAQSGLRTNNFVASDSLTQIAEISALNPDLAIIYLNTNDRRNGDALSLSKSNMTRIIHRLQKTNPYIDIVLVASEPYDSIAWSGSGSQSALAYAEQWRQLSIEENVGFFDNNKLFGTYPQIVAGAILRDGIHEDTAAGYAISANILKSLPGFTTTRQITPPSFYASDGVMSGNRTVNGNGNLATFKNFNYIDFTTTSNKGLRINYSDDNNQVLSFPGKAFLTISALSAVNFGNADINSVNSVTVSGGPSIFTSSSGTHALTVNSPSTSFAFIQDLWAPNLSSGNYALLLMGKAQTTNNYSGILWNHVSDGSADNAFSIGHFVSRIGGNSAINKAFDYVPTKGLVIGGDVVIEDSLQVGTIRDAAPGDSVAYIHNGVVRKGLSSGGTIDAVPTNGSTNAVQSDGVFDGLALKAPLASPVFTTLVTTPGEMVMNATNNNIIHGSSTATSLGFIAGTSTTGIASSGAYIIVTGNTYVTSGQRGNVYIGAGAPSSPAATEAAIYLNSDSIHLTTTSTQGQVFTATGPAGMGKWALPTSVFTTSITAPKVIGSGTAPTATIGSSFTGTVAVVGTDLAGTVTVTMTSTNSSSATLAEVFTLSFNSGYASAPHVVFSPSSATANPTGYFNDVYIKSKSTSNFVVAMAGSRTASGVAVTTFSWDYIVVQ